MDQQLISLFYPSIVAYNLWFVVKLMWKYCGLIDLLINHIGFKVINIVKKKKKPNYSKKRPILKDSQKKKKKKRPILKATYLMQTTKHTRCGIKVDNQRRISSMQNSIQVPNPIDKKSIQAK